MQPVACAVPPRLVRPLSSTSRVDAAARATPSITDEHPLDTHIRRLAEATEVILRETRRLRADTERALVRAYEEP